MSTPYNKSNSHKRRVRRAAKKAEAAKAIEALPMNKLVEKQLLLLNDAYLACLAFEVSTTYAKKNEAYEVGLQVKTYRGVVTSDVAHLQEQITIVQSKLDCAMSYGKDGYSDQFDWGYGHI